MDLPPVTLAQAAWCDQAAAALESAARGDLDAIAADVRAGRANLYRVTGVSDGWLVLRLDDQELVIVAGSGRNARPVIRHLVRLANAEGWTLRAHLHDRPGLIRLYEQCGFSRAEVVVTHGRQ